jgi:hypothetical protein
MNLLIFPMIVKWEKELEMKRQANPAPGAGSGLLIWAAWPSRKTRKSSSGCACLPDPCVSSDTGCHI